MKINKFTWRLLLGVLTLMATLTIVQLASPSKALAVVNLLPDPGNSIPPGQRDLMRRCDELFETSPAYGYFFTVAGSSNNVATSFNVNPSTPTVGLRLNWTSAVCRPNNAIHGTTLQATTHTPGVQDLTTLMAHDYRNPPGPGNYNIPGTFRMTTDDFRYAPPGGFTQSGEYTVRIGVRRIVGYTAGYFRCVSGGSRNPAHAWDFAACSEIVLEAKFWVNYTGNNLPNLTINNTCNGIRVSTNGSRVDVHGPNGGLGSVTTSPGELNLVGRVAPGTRLDVYAIGGANGTSGNRHASHVWTRQGCPGPTTSTISPVANAYFDDRESPTVARLSNATTHNGNGPPHQATVTRRYYVVRGGTSSLISPSVFETPLSSNPISSTINVSWSGDELIIRNPMAQLGLQAGDQVCTETLVNPSVVRVENGVSTVVTGEATSGLVCDKIVNKPFLSVYGADVIAGGSFSDDNCFRDSDIRTSNNASLLGSGVQFAAIALGDISNFSSARLRNTDPVAPIGLSFANTVNPRGHLASPNCVTDYFADGNSLTAQTTTDINLNTLSSGAYKFTNSHTITLRGQVVGNNRMSIYVDGDLRITGNHVGLATDSWSSIDQIPSLRVYVRGNIYIESSVGQLDGVFVAQPNDDGSAGQIVTCVTPGSDNAPGAGALYNECNQRLLINGAFIAERVRFLRAYNSLRDATTANETTAASSRGAEVFNYSPEILLAAPQPTLGSETSQVRYDWFAGLPPIL